MSIQTLTPYVTVRNGATPSFANAWTVANGLTSSDGFKVLNPLSNIAMIIRNENGSGNYVRITVISSDCSHDRVDGPQLVLNGGQTAFLPTFPIGLFNSVANPGYMDVRVESIGGAPSAGSVKAIAIQI